MKGLYLVDDHAVLREGLRILLLDAGFTVLGDCGDMTTALYDIVRLEPEIVLLDLSLGERSGLDLLAQIKQRRLPCRTVVLTMLGQPRHVADAVLLGAEGYVLKGSSGHEVMQAIRSVSAGARWWSPTIAEAARTATSLRSDADSLRRLSHRERQILDQVVRGHTSAAIATVLCLSPKTVETYRHRLMEKLGVGDLPALVRLAIREGLLDVGLN